MSHNMKSIISKLGMTNFMLAGRVLKLLPLLFFITTFSYAQEDDDLGTEVVNIVKPYTPTISDAFKVKETPVLNDSVSTTKKKVDYSIFSVPVASTFTPAKGKAATVEKAKPIKLYDSYATLGFGNYTTILGELYSNFEISRTDNAGIFFKHNSSQGDIKDVLLDNKFYDTQLEGNYYSRNRDMSFGLNAGIEHQVFNWYGLNDLARTFTSEELEAIDPKQTYFSVNIGGNIELDESFFTGAQADLRFLTDGFSSSEINFTASPEFLFEISEMNFKLKGELDYLTGKFDRNYFNTEGIDYGFLNAGLTPSLVYVNDDLTLSLGASIVMGVNTQESELDLFIYPDILASYRLVDELLIAYGGAEGGLNQNTYYNFKNENPFVSPTLSITPTSELYRAFAGLKGKLSNSVGYNMRASFGNENDRALYQINTYKGRVPDLEGYEYGNSFGVIYDDVTTFNAFGELKVEISNTFSLGATVNFFSYGLEDQQEAWNLPELTASVFSNFKITEKIYGGASLFYVGERKDFFTVAQNGIPSTTFDEVVTLDGYVDANLHLGYRVNERLSIFLKGSNLLSDNYEKWLNTPVQGIQGLAGATYKFDW